MIAPRSTDSFSSGNPTFMRLRTSIARSSVIRPMFLTCFLMRATLSCRRSSSAELSSTFSSERYSIQWGADLVGERADEAVVQQFAFGRISTDQLSDCLIDSFVKPRHLRKLNSWYFGALRTHRNRILDRSARYSEIACSRLKPDANRACACIALIQSSALPFGPWPLLFSCCSAESCAVSMSRAIAINISRKSSRNIKSLKSPANAVSCRANFSHARSISSGFA
jgi:hypothetical protein